MYELEVTPQHEISRDHWKPPALDNNEHRYFSDGSHDHKSNTGSSAAVGPISSKAKLISICSSSYQAETQGVELATELAQDEENSLIVFITDSASILTGLKSWPFKHITETQLRILHNIAVLMEKGNTVKFRWVPSHLLDDESMEENSPLKCPDTEGNQAADILCGLAMTHKLKLKTAPITTDTPTIKSEIIKQRERRFLQNRGFVKSKDSLLRESTPDVNTCT